MTTPRRLRRPAPERNRVGRCACRRFRHNTIGLTSHHTRTGCWLRATGETITAGHWPLRQTGMDL